MYMDKVLALAHLHVLLGSTKEAFNADLKSRGVADTATTKKLTKDQFDIVNKGNAAIRLEGTATDEGDQQIYDETAMLCTAVNTRLDRHCQRCASRPVGH
jgi:replicative DNA helicase